MAQNLLYLLDGPVNTNHDPYIYDIVVDVSLGVVHIKIKYVGI